MFQAKLKVLETRGLFWTQAAACFQESPGSLMASLSQTFILSILLVFELTLVSALLAGQFRA